MSEVNTIDLDALDETALEEDVTINPDVNPMDTPAPPDDGTHRTKLLALPSSQVDIRQTNNDAQTPFISFKFSGQILAEGTRNHNKRIFGNVTTLVFDGKSEMAQIIKVARGGTNEAKQFVASLNNFGKLAKAFKTTLAGEPVIGVKTKWVAQRKVEENGKTKYQTVLSGQKNFPLVDPKNPSLGHRHVIFDKVSGTEIAAQAVIQDYLVDGVA